MMTNPEKIALLQWANALVVDFPRDNISILKDEEDWKSWGNSLIQENSFTRNGAPGTAFYKEWRAWARDVFYTMANL